MKLTSVFVAASILVSATLGSPLPLPAQGGGEVIPAQSEINSALRELGVHDPHVEEITAKTWETFYVPCWGWNEDLVHRVEEKDRRAGLGKRLFPDDIAKVSIYGWPQEDDGIEAYVAKLAEMHKHDGLEKRLVPTWIALATWAADEYEATSKEGQDGKQKRNVFDDVAQGNDELVARGVYESFFRKNAEANSHPLLGKKPYSDEDLNRISTYGLPQMDDEAEVSVADAGTIRKRDPAFSEDVDSLIKRDVLEKRLGPALPFFLTLGMAELTGTLATMGISKGASGRTETQDGLQKRDPSTDIAQGNEELAARSWFDDLLHKLEKVNTHQAIAKRKLPDHFAQFSIYGPPEYIEKIEVAGTIPKRDSIPQPEP